MPGRKLNAPTCTPNGSKGFGSVSGRQLGGTVATVTVSASGLKGGAPGRDWLRSWLSSGLADEGGRAGGISRGRGATVVTLMLCFVLLVPFFFALPFAPSLAREPTPPPLNPTGLARAPDLLCNLRRPPLLESKPVDPAPLAGADPKLGAWARPRLSPSSFFGFLGAA